MDEPMQAKSNTASDDPSRLKPKMESAAPQRINVLSDIAEPIEM
jgi:hypothetical protein